MKSINKFYFQVAFSNPNEQLFTFARLVQWILKLIGVNIPVPDQFDDPNSTCANIVAELKKLGISFEFGPTKLKQGYGEACIYVLQTLVDLAIVKQKVKYLAPVHSQNDYP